MNIEILFLVISAFIPNIFSELINPTQDSYQNQNLLSSMNYSLYFTIESKYIPSSYLFQNKGDISSTKYTIFCLQNNTIDSDQVSYTFLYYLNLDISQNRVKHYFEIQTSKNKYFEFYQASILQYEGFWFTLEIRNDAIKQVLNITLYQNNNKNFILYQKLILNENFLIEDNFSYYLGNSKISKALKLNQFQGQIKFNLIPFDSSFTPQSQASCSSNSGYALRSNSNFTLTTFYEFTVLDLIFKSYGITTWVKINQNLDANNNFANIIHIQSNPNQPYLTQVGGKLLQISYLINSTNQLVEIVYQSYSFPILPSLINNQDPLEKIITLDFPIAISLYLWHYLSVSYRNNQIVINLNFVKLNKIITKTIVGVYQFSDLSLILHFGGTSYNYCNTNGVFVNPYFYNCLTIFAPKCHFSCTTCFGPNQNQCLSCSISSNRQLSSDQTCICKIGFLENNSTSCYSLTASQIQETYIPLSSKIGYDQEYPEIVCSYGYFKYEDECFECPKLNKIYFCPECIQYPNTWVFYPRCTKDYGQYDKNINNTFTQDIIFKASNLLIQLDQYDIYLFNDKQINFCSYCSSLCLTPPYDSGCQYGSYFHLQMPVMVICVQGAIFYDGRCQQCSQNCSQCIIVYKEFVCKEQITPKIQFLYCSSQIYTKCLRCLNDNQYYFNFQNTDCYICSIPHCKYCFEYIIQNPFYNSIFNNASLEFEQEDLATGCALCEDGYIFNFFQGICEKNTLRLGDNCQRYYVTDINTAICLISSSFSFGISISNCNIYLTKCKKCIKPQTNQYYCLECEIGYYLNQKLGICQSCIDYNQLYFDCFQKDQTRNISLIYESTPQLFSMQGQYPGIRPSSSFTIIVKQCVSGYYQESETLCIPTDSIYCSQYNLGCRHCESTSEGTKRLTILNLKCSDCPFYCEYCKPRLNNEISQINPYLNFTLITQIQLTYRCIQKSSLHNNIFLDNKQQLSRLCTAEFPKCQLQFSTNVSSFSYLQSQISNILVNQNLYYNLRSINIFQIFLNIANNYLYQNSFIDFVKFQNNLITQIASLHTTKLSISFNDSSKGFIFGKLRFQDFQEIKFISSSIIFSITTQSKIIFESKGKIKFYLENVVIRDTYEVYSSFSSIFDTVNPARQYQIAIQNPSLINFTNVIVQNISIINQIFFNLTTIEKGLNLQKFYLYNITFFNCTFLQTSLISLSENNQYIDISINKIKFIQCKFFTSKFLNCENLQENGSFTISVIDIQDCQLYDSVFIFLPIYSTIVIEKFSVFNSLLENTDLILTSSSLSLIYVTIQNNILIHFNLLKKMKSEIANADETYFLKQFNIQNNKYNDFMIIQIYQYYSENIYISVIELVQNNLTSLNIQSDREQYFYNFQGEIIYMKNINFTRFPGSKDFLILDSFSVQILNVTIQCYFSSQNYEYPNLEEQSLNSLFSIVSENTIIKNLKFFNQIGVDVIFIKIQGNNNSNSKIQVQIEQLEINHLQLVKTSFSQICTFIQSLNSINQDVSISNSTFTNVILNEFVQDTKVSSAALAVFVSDSGQVNFENIQLNQVSVLNSTNSIFLIQCSELKIDNFLANNINTYLQYSNDNNVVFLFDINQFIESVQINSLGGLFNSQAQSITVTNSIFLNTLALQGGVFYITTKQNGQIYFINNTFYNTSTNSRNLLDGKGGCIFINSENSYLHFSFQQNYIENSTSGQQAGAIYIKPSQYQSSIFISYLQMKNIFSLKNSVIYVSVVDLNFGAISKIIIENLFLDNQFDEFCNFLIRFKLKLNENLINQQNAIFYFSDCFVQIQNFTFIGFTIHPIFYVKFAKILAMNKVQFQNITHITNCLIYIENSISKFSLLSLAINSSLLIKDLTIKNSTEKNLEANINKTQNETYSNLMKFQYALNNSFYQKSLIFIMLDQNMISSHIKLLQLINNNCELCNAGIVHLKNYQIQKKLRLQNQIYLNNFCGIDSCFSIESYDNDNKYNLISESRFINNTAIQFGALKSINNSLLIRNTSFVKNTASFLGGAIYYNNLKNNLMYERVFFFNNKAFEGGAVYDFNCYNNSQKNSYYFLQNSADFYGNNIATIATQLKMFLNDVKMIQTENISNEQQFAQAFYYNHGQIMEYLYFPSGSSLNQYFLFDWRNLQFNKYNFSIKVKAQNIFGEVMIQDNESMCISNSSIIEAQKDKAQLFSNNSNTIQTIFYNYQSQSFNLNDLVYTLDPNQNNISTLMVYISCQNIENFQLKFYIKTLKCQIGEYSGNSQQCVKCDSNQGFYSVEKNSKSCKRIDFKMIKTTTGAMLELQSGFWRPDLRSDLIEQCSKHPVRCLGGWNVNDSTCNLGAIGALCEQCDIYNIRGDGSFINNGNENCSQCGQILFQIVIFLLQSLWIIFTISLTVNSNNFSNKQLFKLKCLYRHFEAVYKQKMDQTSTVIKLANNHLQILSLVETFQIKVLWNLQNVVLFLGDSNYMVSYQIDCSLPYISPIDYEYAHYILIMLLPLFHFSMCCMMLFSLIICKKVSYSKSYIYSTIIYLYCLNQQNLIKWGVSLISKRTISGIDWIQANVASKFYSENHFNWSIRFIYPMLIIIGIIIPLFFYLQLRAIRQCLDNRQARLKYSFLYNEYNPNSYYWEIIKMIQKISIILIVNYYEQHIEVKGLIIFLILLLYYYTCQQIKPYKLQSMSQIDIKTSFILSLIIALSLLLHVIQSENLFYLDYSIQIIIFFLIFVLIETILHRIIKSYASQINLELDYIRKIIKNKIPSITQQFTFLKPLLELRFEQQQRIQLRFEKIRKYLKTQSRLINKNNMLHSQSKESNYIGINLFSQNTSKRLITTERETHAKMLD